MRILIVEDEPRLANNIARSLRESVGYAVDLSLDGADGAHMATQNEYDLIILDLMLPKKSGQVVLREIREQKVLSPVLILTANDAKTEVARLLNEGADDYLTKPFDLGELLARSKALIRRGKGRAHPLLRISDLTVDTTALRATRAGRTIDLTPMEFRVLEFLAYHAGEVVSKNTLLEHLYDYNWEKFSNVVEVYISGLRKKIDDWSSVKLLHTVRGRGYVLGERP
jgi:DNA-binding response OmpR family regulator